MMLWFSLFLVGMAGYLSYRYAWWKGAVDYRYPRILMYHMIKEHRGGKFKGLRVSPEMFEKQIRYLSEQGWHFYTMSELVAQRKNLPKHSVAITFDDGYEDNYTQAFPILKKYGAKATIYLVTDRHGREWSSRRKAKNSGGELMREPKLSDTQVEEMIASGLIEIGSHTVTHDNLPQLESADKREEIIGSKEALEKRFGIRCLSFCYPFGLYDEEDVRLVQEVGYTNAVTTQSGIEDMRNADLFRLKRITVSGKDNFSAFWLKLRHGRRGVRK